MHPRLLRAWSKAKSLAREVRLHADLWRGGLVPLPDAVGLVWRYLPESAIDTFRETSERWDIKRDSYIANAIASQYPLWGCANGHGKFGRIPFRISGQMPAHVSDGGWSLEFSSDTYGFFDCLHVKRSHLLAWIKWARFAPNTDPIQLRAWPCEADAFFVGPPLNPRRSRSDEAYDAGAMDAEAVEAMLKRKIKTRRKIDSMVKPDVGKPKKRWKKVLKRKNARRKA